METNRERAATFIKNMISEKGVEAIGNLSIIDCRSKELRDYALGVLLDLHSKTSEEDKKDEILWYMMKLLMRDVDFIEESRVIPHLEKMCDLLEDMNAFMVGLLHSAGAKFEEEKNDEQKPAPPMTVQQMYAERAQAATNKK